jgi:hypothetical protein
MLAKKYINLGFRLSDLNGLQVLEFRNRIIFILGDNFHIRSGFVRQLCNTYLNSFEPSAEMVTAGT